MKRKLLSLLLAVCAILALTICLGITAAADVDFYFEYDLPYDGTVCPHCDCGTDEFAQYGWDHYWMNTSDKHEWFCGEQIGVVVSGAHNTDGQKGECTVCGYLKPYTPCSMNDTNYTSLEAAIEVANDGDIITLIDDIALSETVLIDGKAITIDLNGHKISNKAGFNDTLIAVSGNASLNLIDSTAEAGEVGTGSIEYTGNPGDKMRVILMKGAFSAKGISIKATREYGAAEPDASSYLYGLYIEDYAQSSANIEDCSIEVTNFKDDSSKWYYAYGVYAKGQSSKELVMENVSVTCTGGAYTFGVCAESYGKVKLTECVFKINDNADNSMARALYLTNVAECELESGKYDVSAPAGTANIASFECKNVSTVATVTGGGFTAEGYGCAYLLYANTNSSTTGASFTANIDAGICKISKSASWGAVNILGVFGENCVAKITGGNFSLDPSAFVNETYYNIQKETDNTYTVSKNIFVVIGDKAYKVMKNPGPGASINTFSVASIFDDIFQDYQTAALKLYNDSVLSATEKIVVAYTTGESQYRLMTYKGESFPIIGVTRDELRDDYPDCLYIDATPYTIVGYNGDVLYIDLQEAIDEAKDGDTIKLASDITLTTRLDIKGKNITLDLNGKTLTFAMPGTTAAITLESVTDSDQKIHRGGLTVCDNSEEQNGKIEITGTNVGIRLRENCDVTVNSGAISASYAGQAETRIFTAKESGATVTITGGTFSVFNGHPEGHTCLITTGSDEPTVTVSGGKFNVRPDKIENSIVENHKVFNTAYNEWVVLQVEEVIVKDSLCDDVYYFEKATEAGKAPNLANLTDVEKAYIQAYFKANYEGKKVVFSAADAKVGDYYPVFADYPDFYIIVDNEGLKRSDKAKMELKVEYSIMGKTFADSNSIVLTDFFFISKAEVTLSYVNTSDKLLCIYSVGTNTLGNANAGGIVISDKVADLSFAGKDENATLNLLCNPIYVPEKANGYFCAVSERYGTDKSVGYKNLNLQSGIVNIIVPDFTTDRDVKFIAVEAKATISGGAMNITVGNLKVKKMHDSSEGNQSFLFATNFAMTGGKCIVTVGDITPAEGNKIALNFVRGNLSIKGNDKDEPVELRITTGNFAGSGSGFHVFVGTSIFAMDASAGTVIFEAQITTGKLAWTMFNFKQIADKNGNPANPDESYHPKKSLYFATLYEAAIGETKYLHFTDALEAAKNGETVKVLADVTLTNKIEIKGKKLTIDLNGKKISLTTNIQAVTEAINLSIDNNIPAELTVCDSSAKQNGSISMKYTSSWDASCIALDAACSFTLESGNLSVETTQKNAYVVSGNISTAATDYGKVGTITIKGGSLSAKANEDKQKECLWFNGPKPSSNTFIVTGGKFSQDISDFINRVNYESRDNKDGTFTVMPIVAANAAGDPATSWDEVTKIYHILPFVDGEYVSFSIFSIAHLSQRVAQITDELQQNILYKFDQGTYLFVKPDGTIGTTSSAYTDLMMKEETFEANVYGTDSKIVGKYNTLAEAVAAAKDGETVKLLTDVTLGTTDANNGISVNKAITVDLNGKTVSTAINGFIMQDDAATLTNGKIVSTKQDTGYEGIAIEFFNDAFASELEISGKFQTGIVVSGKIIAKVKKLTVTGTEMGLYVAPACILKAEIITVASDVVDGQIDGKLETTGTKSQNNNFNGKADGLKLGANAEADLTETNFQAPETAIYLAENADLTWKNGDYGEGKVGIDTEPDKSCSVTLKGNLTLTAREKNLVFDGRMSLYLDDFGCCSLLGFTVDIESLKSNPLVLIPYDADDLILDLEKLSIDNDTEQLFDFYIDEYPEGLGDIALYIDYAGFPVKGGELKDRFEDKTDYDFAEDRRFDEGNQFEDGTFVMDDEAKDIFVPAGVTVTVDLDGKTLDLNKVGFQVNGTLIIKNGTIKGAKNVAAIYVYDGGSLEAENVTFENCSDTYGGAVYAYGVANSHITVTLTDCTFTGCSANYGGAIYFRYADAEISGCAFTDCKADYYGGVVCSAYSDFTVTDSSFDNCITTSESYDCYGSAFYLSYDTVSFKECTFNGCKGACTEDTDSFGAIYAYFAEVELKECTFTDCEASSGAAYSAQYSEATLIDCDFMNCSAVKYGGAICCSNSEVTVSGCEFIDCKSDYYFGAIYNYESKFTVTDSSFDGCSGAYVGAVGADNDDNEDAFMNISGCTFTNCRAENEEDSNCGAVGIWSMPGSIENCKFENCSAQNRMAALYLYDCEVIFKDNTVTGCKEAYDGAIYLNNAHIIFDGKNVVYGNHGGPYIDNIVIGENSTFAFGEDFDTESVIYIHLDEDIDLTKGRILASEGATEDMKKYLHIERYNQMFVLIDGDLYFAERQFDLDKTETRELAGDKEEDNAFEGLPTDIRFKYTISQTVYTPDEIGDVGLITEIAYKLVDGEANRKLKIYMKELYEDSFDDRYDWDLLEGATLVYNYENHDGKTHFNAGEWTAITLDKTFGYSGGNLLVCVIDDTGSYETYATFCGFVGDENCTIYKYRDNFAFEIPYLSPVEGMLTDRKAAAQFTVAPTAVPEITCDGQNGTVETENADLNTATYTLNLKYFVALMDMDLFELVLDEANEGITWSFTKTDAKTVTLTMTIDETVAEGKYGFKVTYAAGEGREDMAAEIALVFNVQPTIPEAVEGYTVNDNRTITIEEGYEVIERPQDLADIDWSNPIANGAAIKPNTTYLIRKAETGTTPASDYASFTTKKAPAAADFNVTYPEAPVFGGDNTVTAETEIDGIGEITVQYFVDGIWTTEVPVHAGTYAVRLVVEAGEAYFSAVIDVDDLTIAKLAVDVPTVNGTYTYSGKNIDLKLDNFNADFMTVTGNTGKAAKDYTAHVELDDDHEWATAFDGDIAWTINPLNIASAEIELGDALTYTGKELTQEVISVTIRQMLVTFTVSDNTATDAGSYELTVTGNGNFCGTATKTFTVAQAKNAIHDLAIEGWTYGDEANTATATADFGTVVFSFKDMETTPTEAGKYTVVATVKETANYAGATAEVEFEILPLDITGAVITLADELVYTGKELTANVVSVTVGKFTVTYTVSGNTATNAGEYTLTVTGNGNFCGKETKTFTVAQAKNAIHDLAIDGWIYSKTAKTPSATADFGEITFKFTDADGKQITPKAVGTYYVVATVEETANYAGAEAKVSFEISPLNIASAEIELGDALTYTGKELTQEVISVTIRQMMVTYTVSGNTATDAGSYELTVTGNGNFCGTATKTFTVAQAKNAIHDLAIEGWTYGDEANTATATADFGTVVFTFTTADGEPVAAPTNVGSYKVIATVEETANYAGATEEIAFVIKALDIKDAVITLDDNDLVYTGSILTKNVIGVTVKGMTLTENDFSVSGNTAIDAVEYTLTVTGKGNFVGTAEATFTVAQAPNSIKNLAIDGWIYSTTAKAASATADFGTPVFTFTDADGNQITPNAAGTYYVVATVAETANYAGAEAKVAFDISPLNIASAEIELGDALTYTGKELTQEVIAVTIRQMMVTFTVSDNTATDAGEYTLTVTGNGNFCGTATKTFTVAQAKNAIHDLAIEGWTYGDEANTATATADFGNVTFAFKDIEGIPTAAGKYTVIATVEETANYAGATAECEVEIAKRAVKVTIADQSTVYGKALAKLTFTVTEGNFIGDEMNSITLTTDAKNVGKYKITGACGNENYDVTFVEGTYTVLYNEIKGSEGVTIKTEKGLNPYTELIVKNVELDDVKNVSVKESVGGNRVIKQVYDLSLEADNTKVQPNGTVIVVLPISEDLLKDKNLSVVYIDANGNTENMNATRENDTLVFEATHFSQYAIVGTGSLALILTIVGIVVVAGAGVCVYFFVYKKKKKNA